MNDREIIIWTASMFLMMVVGVALMTETNVEAGGGGGCISARMEQTDFSLNNAYGMNSQEFETELIVTNDCGESRNITIRFTAPDGYDTGASDEINPRIYKDEARNKDKGASYDVQVEPGKTTFYPSILVNDTAFADIYSFRCEIDDNDDGSSDDPVESIEITVDVGEFNNIDIEWYSKEDKENTLVEEGLTEYYLELTNRGNIWNERVGVEIEHDFPSNISVAKINIPETGNRINPEFYGYDFSLIVGVQILVEGNNDAEVHVFNVKVKTPNNDPNIEGQNFVECKLIIQERGGHKNVTNDPQNGMTVIEKTMVGGGFVGIITMMGAILHFFVLKGQDPDDDWGDPEWGDDSNYNEGGEWDEDNELMNGELLNSGVMNSKERDGGREGPKGRTGPRENVRVVGRESKSDGGRPGSREERGVRERVSEVVPSDRSITMVKCPKCATKMKITNQKRPLTILCPHCPAKMTLKGEDMKTERKSTPSPEIGQIKITRVKCLECMAVIKVKNPKRPLSIHCPRCKNKMRLNGRNRSKANAQVTSRQDDTPAPPTSFPSSSPVKTVSLVSRVSCLKCHVKMKITDQKRPLKVACPKCKIKLHLK